ncbi:MAG TPA: hypothetical protein VIX17_10710, partial [Pyrinomonadaceae bacterium]
LSLSKAMSTRTLADRTFVQRNGRPKGVPTKRIQRMLNAWDLINERNPKLNDAALINIVAESLFGIRLNARRSAKEKACLKRALQR